MTVKIVKRAKLILLLVLVIQSQSRHTESYVVINPVLWLTSPIRVIDTLQDYTVYVVFNDSCDQLADNIWQGVQGNMSKILLEEYDIKLNSSFKHWCLREYEDKILTPFREFCDEETIIDSENDEYDEDQDYQDEFDGKKGKEQQNVLKRTKRHPTAIGLGGSVAAAAGTTIGAFIGWLGVVVLVVAAIYVTASYIFDYKLNSIFTWWGSPADTTTIKITQHLQDMSNATEHLVNAQETTMINVRKHIYDIASIKDFLRFALQQHRDELFLLFQAQSQINDYHERIISIITMGRQGRVSSVVLGMFKLDESRETDLESSKFKSCSFQRSRRLLKLKFDIPLANPNLTLLEADAFMIEQSVYDKDANETLVCGLRYTGPRFVVSRNNCLFEIDQDPYTWRKTAFAFPQHLNCTPDSQLNFNNHWSIGKCSRSSRTPIQVKETPSAWYIYCPNSTLTMGRQNRQVHSCPDFVFQIRRDRETRKANIVIGEGSDCVRLSGIFTKRTIHVDFQKQFSVEQHYHIDRHKFEFEQARKLEKHLSILHTFKMRKPIILSTQTNGQQLTYVLLIACAFVILVIICVCSIRCVCTK